MNTITHETRAAGHEAITPHLDSMETKVYNAVLCHGGLTAEEVDAETNIGLNNARSRCTEHLTGGRFKVERKKLNRKGNRMIAVYEVA